MWPFEQRKYRYCARFKVCALIQIAELARVAIVEPLAGTCRTELPIDIQLIHSSKSVSEIVRREYVSYLLSEPQGCPSPGRLTVVINWGCPLSRCAIYMLRFWIANGGIDDV